MSDVVNDCEHDYIAMYTFLMIKSSDIYLQKRNKCLNIIDLGEKSLCAYNTLYLVRFSGINTLVNKISIFRANEILHLLF